MALAFTFRSSLHSTTNGTVFDTTSAFTPAAHSLMVAVIRSTGKADTPTDVVTTNVTNRYTFAEVYNNGSGSAYFGIWVADSGATPPNDTIRAALTASNASGCHISVIEVTGADMTGTALQAIVDTATITGSSPDTTATITYNAASNAANRPLAAYAVASNVAVAPRANWDELDDGNFISPSDAVEVQSRSDAFETTGTATWTGSLSWTALGIEIKALVPAGGGWGFIPI